MKYLAIATTVLALSAGAAGAATVEFDVYAADHSIEGETGGSGLDTGISLTSGDSLTITVDPMDSWNIGIVEHDANGDRIDNGTTVHGPLTFYGLPLRPGRLSVKSTAHSSWSEPALMVSLHRQEI